MTDLKDDDGKQLSALSTDQLEFLLSLPHEDEHWDGCPYEIDVIKEAVRKELAKRKTAGASLAGSPEFQDASQKAAEKIRDAILLLSQSPGQTVKTALTGALCALAELQIQLRPAGTEESDVLMKGAETFLYYGAQFMNGCAIDHDRPEKSN